MDKVEYLARINIMEILPHAALTEVARVTPMNTAPKGTVIMDPNKPQDVIYLLKEGRVRLYQLSSEGKEFTTSLLGPGNIFGHSGMVSTGTENCHAEALEDVVLCLLRRPDMERLMNDYPQLSLKLVEVLSARIQESQRLMRYMALGDVRSRLLYLLLKLASEFGHRQPDSWIQISADLAHKDLAAMVGSSREHVSATLSQLVREGIVRTARRAIWVQEDLARMHLEAMG